MKSLQFLRPFFFSNLFVGFCAVGLYAFFTMSASLYESAMLFSAIMVTYSFLKIKGQSNPTQNNASQVLWLVERTKYTFGTIVLFSILGLWAWWKLDFYFPPQLVFAGLFMSVYFLFRFKMYSFAYFAGFHALAKIATVAMVWTFSITSFFTFQTSRELAIFFFMMALMIPFEIKDLPFDENFQTRTVPILWGIQIAKMLGYGFLILSIFFFMQYAPSTIDFLAWIVSCLVGAVLIYFSESSRDELYFLAFVDGVMLLPIFLKCFFKCL